MFTASLMLLLSKLNCKVFYILKSPNMPDFFFYDTVIFSKSKPVIFSFCIAFLRDSLT